MDINWGAILTQLLQEWGPVVITAIVGYIGLQIRQALPVFIAEYQARTTAHQRALIAAIVHNAVYAAEQIVKRDDVKGVLLSKFNLANAAINKEFEKYNIQLTAQEIEQWVEAAVAELNTQQGKG
jgi:hypothetical protein